MNNGWKIAQIVALLSAATSLLISILRILL